jgi:type IV pilus assembly protein PilX
MTRGSHLSAARQVAGGQRGVALISAMLLLVIITILALSMFRSFPIQEKIAGNVREKERAFHAANSALQFGEWWLLANVATGDIVCAGQPALLNGNLLEGQICANQLYTTPLGPGLIGNLTALGNVPWTVGGNPVGVQFKPTEMNVLGNPGTEGNDSNYISAPVFYIADLGAAGDAAGEAYQIDAYAYGGSTNTVAVVESIYEVAQGVVNRTGE